MKNDAHLGLSSSARTTGLMFAWQMLHQTAMNNNYFYPRFRAPNSAIIMTNAVTSAGPFGLRGGARALAS